MDPLDLAGSIRSAILEAANRAYEDAGVQGLCPEGRWEAAVSAVQQLDLHALVHRLNANSASLVPDPVREIGSRASSNLGWSPPPTCA